MYYNVHYYEIYCYRSFIVILKIPSGCFEKNKNLFTIIIYYCFLLKKKGYGQSITAE